MQNRNTKSEGRRGKKEKRTLKTYSTKKV